MDDSCAVCAEALEWVAYGSCGHREVCSTCVARLRFICNDPRCCICKTESDIIFVTKALGDYTRMINDFLVFSSDSREGKVGSFWYHEDTQAYFDDSDHYRMIKAMCRLSCSVCENMEEQGNDGPKRRPKFKNIDQLKSHLYHRHRLLMCSLCLEGRKIFICEQKLYTRAQLNQHINTGDSVVDGNESERGGFMGHPMCEFCRDPFYGDNELYTHMSTEHYTCHICQRQNPGQYEYYKDYNDLEIHFRREHFLCEDEACLAKKFIVFPSEPELKRHNATEHGGRMSRSQRNAALQIPISFRYRRSNDQDRRRGRGRALNPDSSDNQLSLAILASFETINADGTTPESSGREVVSEQQETNEIDPILGPFESLAIMDSDTSSRYLHAVRQKSSNARLEDSSFPPLSLAPGSSQLKSKNDLEKMATNNMAARLRRHNNGNVNVLNKARALPAANRGRALSSSSQPAAGDGSGSSSYSSSTQIKQVTVNEAGSTDSSSSSWNFVSSRRLGHSSSAPNLVDRESIDSSTSNFPPVSVRQKHKLSTDAATQKLTTSNQYVLNVEDVHAANSSLVERIRATLEFDEDKYSAFKGISAEYRQGLIGTEEYLLYVQQFGLSHLVLELARLCPDAQKQKELIEIYNANFRGKGLQENGFENSSAHSKKINPSQKGKGKCVDNGVISPKDKLADSIISTVRKLQSSYKPSDEELEVLPKDGYRAAAAKGKTKFLVDEKQAEVSYAPHHVTESGRQNDSQSTDSGSNLNPGPRGGESKQRKKTSKFHRVRLGDGSAAALLDLRQPDPGPDPVEETTDGNQNIPSGLPVRSVWRNGGGQRLMSMSQRDPKSFR